MTAQKIFDTVINHLLQQGVPALNYNYDAAPSCRYRTRYGLKCAVGCLISDDAYDPLMEGKNVAIEGPFVDLLNWWIEEHYGSHRKLLRDLQFLHDSEQASSPGEWQTAILKGAAEIARMHGLAMPPTQP